MGVTIIGAGLAGSEAAWQVAARGHSVLLHEMRPQVMTKAHKTGLAAELVCSNSFRGQDLSNAVGLLKEELKLWNSLVLQAAAHAQIPAGGALAVDRVKFSEFVDASIRQHPLIRVVEGEILELPEYSPAQPLIVATGPLTGKTLAKQIESITGKGSLAFFDAISPIILAESINESVCFRQSRYEKGGGADYLNVPLSKDEYYAFIESIQAAEKYGGHEEVESDCIEGVRPFEGCMPIEEMIARGPDTLRFGPLKPVGLSDPRTGKRPYAVVQLRQDNTAGTLWNMVGMQTRMKHPEQIRILRSLPGLEEAEFVRLGSVHRNTFIDSPKCLDSTLEFRTRPGLFFAGQVTGTEGYVESTAGGLIAGLNAARYLEGQRPISVPIDTAIGSLLAYISDPAREYFQPMNISYGLMPAYARELEAESLKKKKKEAKKERRIRVAEQAIAETIQFIRLLSPALDGQNSPPAA